MLHDTTINDLTFHVMAAVDIFAVFLYLIVYSLLVRLTADEKEHKEPTTKIGKWINNTKIAKFFDKHEQTIIKVTRKVFFVFMLFLIYAALVTGTKKIFEITNGATTDIEIVTIINMAVIFGGILSLIAFIDKIQLFKRREKQPTSKGGANLVKEINN